MLAFGAVTGIVFRVALLLAAPLRTPTRATVAIAGADRIGPLVAELHRRGIEAFCSSGLISYRLDFVTNLRVTGGDCAAPLLRRRGNVVYPAVIEPTRYPELSRRLAAARYPAWVFIAGTDDELRAKRLLAAAGYRRTETSVFAVYARGPR